MMSQAISDIWIGALGDGLGGLAVGMIASATSALRRRLEPDDIQKELEGALQEALLVAADEVLRDQPITVTKYYIECLVSYLQRDEVQRRLVVLLEPRPFRLEETAALIDDLHDQFYRIAQYPPEEIPDLDFDAYLNALFGAFYKAAESKPTLREIIELRVLNQMCSTMNSVLIASNRIQEDVHLTAIHTERLAEKLDRIVEQLKLMRQELETSRSNVILAGVEGSPSEIIQTIEKLIDKGNLPSKAYHQLIGRNDDQEKLLTALRQPGGSICAVYGLGGIGKTALAREVAGQIEGEGIFDHIVWSSAKVDYFVGTEVIHTGNIVYNFETLLNDIGRQCNRFSITALPNLNEKRAAIAKLLSEKRVLVVVDNLETIPEFKDLVRQTYAILNQSKLLITSRERIKTEVIPIQLGGLSEDAGMAFLRSYGAERNVTAVTTAPDNTLLTITRSAGGAPLALKLIAGQLSSRNLDFVLDQIREVRGDSVDFYDFVYRSSWEILDINGKKALIEMAVFPPLIGGTVAAIEDISKLENEILWASIEQLVVMSLVDKLGYAGEERYVLHPLTHNFVVSHIKKLDF